MTIILPIWPIILTIIHFFAYNFDCCQFSQKKRLTIYAIKSHIWLLLTIIWLLYLTITITINIMNRINKYTVILTVKYYFSKKFNYVSLLILFIIFIVLVIFTTFILFVLFILFISFNFVCFVILVFFMHSWPSIHHTWQSKQFKYNLESMNNYDEWCTSNFCATNV